MLVIGGTGIRISMSEPNLSQCSENHYTCAMTEVVGIEISMSGLTDVVTVHVCLCCQQRIQTSCQVSSCRTSLATALFLIPFVSSVEGTTMRLQSLHGSVRPAKGTVRTKQALMSATNVYLETFHWIAKYLELFVIIQFPFLVHVWIKSLQFHRFGRYDGALFVQCQLMQWHSSWEYGPLLFKQQVVDTQAISF